MIGMIAIQTKQNDREQSLYLEGYDMGDILKNLYLFLRRLRLNIKLMSEKDFNNFLKDERLDYKQRLYLVYFRYM